MSAKCQITGKRMLTGNKVSHSQIKTKRVYKVNLQKVSLFSDALKQKLSLKIATSTLRSIDHNGGIDNFLLKSSNKELTDFAKKLKKKIVNALEGSEDENGSDTSETDKEAA